MPKTWFITGAAGGFGREWTEAALERGDRVAAAARDAARLDDLRAQHGERMLALELDVTDRARAFAAVQEAAEHFGVLDVVVNNAGFGQIGMVEELAEAEVRAQLETNFLGALWVTQAALPIFRAQGHGHLVQVTSEGGVIAYPSFGAYHASKWALEGLTQSLAQEVAGFGIDVTLVEPGAYGTAFGGAAPHSEEIGVYDELRDRVAAGWSFGDPVATRAAILEVVDAEQPPLRVFFGAGSLDRARADYTSRLQTWEAWQDLAVRAGG